MTIIDIKTQFFVVPEKVYDSHVKIQLWFATEAEAKTYIKDKTSRSDTYYIGKLIIRSGEPGSPVYPPREFEYIAA